MIHWSEPIAGRYVGSIDDDPEVVVSVTLDLGTGNWIAYAGGKVITERGAGGLAMVKLAAEDVLDPCICITEAMNTDKLEPLACRVCGRGDEPQPNEETEPMAKETDNGTPVRLSDEERQQRLARLFEVETKLDEGIDKKKIANDRFNEQSKALRKERKTLLGALQTGWERQERQTTLLNDDGSKPPRGHGRPAGGKKAAKKRAKKGSKKAAKK